MRARLKYVEGLTFVGQAGSGHWTVLDSPHGERPAAATSPMEMILLALMGCSAMDVVAILRKMRAPFVDLEVEVEADRAETHPRVYTRLHLSYRVKGRGLEPEQVARAVLLSQEKYCSVAAMLRASVPISYEAWLEDAETGERKPVSFVGVSAS
ncbi:MAG: OsmC family protein [Bacteroidetes bacterium]|nr:OsmC family protein [Rhodothermia bacterium]MCS7154263.1 OsmC family protein [Bacteroidota bacterium]MCX7906701.1 OsmC family protein [Bacteroidota bacterium]MDW8137019.1 OsmC family protein [Bacteroidota bacterium]MDW8285110.1 OsmC family protein [Bacteroidota bacterium]